MKNIYLYTTKRIFLIVLGAVLMAINLRTFVHAGGILPGGFTGLTLLIQEICLRYFNFQMPFSVVYYALNLGPALICFIYVGKKFTAYSILMVVILGFLADWLPPMFTDWLKLQDILLSAIFGGILNAVSVALCLNADATSGGTDFIAIFLSERYRKDAWNYILFGNCIILAAAGILFSLDIALYSIIFQYVTTVALGLLYKRYQQRTLLIITNKPDAVTGVINEMTHHGATHFKGVGSYEKKERTLLYSVVTASDIKKLIPEIKKADDETFINVLQTQQLNGRFYQQPKD